MPPAPDGEVRAPPASSIDDARPPDALLKPRRIIDRSLKIARVEDGLGKALSVPIIGDSVVTSVDARSVELARLYEIPVESLEFHCLCPGDYLLVLPDEATASRVYNGGRPLQIPPFNVVCWRWSHFKVASGVALPHLLDVELSGIPAHAWELEIAEHLLDDWCWVRELHPDTINR
jgi:hypothetical protein